MVPVVVLLYDRAFLAGSFKRALRRRWVLYVALAATWAPLAWLVASAHGRAGSAGWGNNLTTWEYARTQPGIILHYLALAFWPQGQCLDYDWAPARMVSKILPGVLAIAVLLGATIWAFWKRPRWGFVGAAFFVILAPTSSIIPIRDLAFEHRMYLPLAAVIALVVLAGHGLWQKATARFAASTPRTLWRPAAIIVVGGLLAALVWRTSTRNEDYRTGLTIWQATVDRVPGNPRAHNNLGKCLDDAGETTLAYAHYLRALELQDDYADAHNNLGVCSLAPGGSRTPLPTTAPR